MSAPHPPPFQGPPQGQPQQQPPGYPQGPPQGFPQGKPPGYAQGAPASYQGPVLDVSGTPPIPFARLVKVELRKALDTSAGFWLLAAIAVLIIIVEGFLLVIGLLNGDTQYRLVDFTTLGGYVLQPLLPIVVALQVTSEWSQRTAMVTFATEPRRLVVVYAKLAAGAMVALLMTVVLFAVALVCLLLLWVFQDNVDWGTSLSGTVGLLVFLFVGVAVAFAAATLLLNTPATIVTFLAVIYAVPTVVATIGALWADFRDFGRYLNLQGALYPVLSGTLDSGSEWARLLVALLIWVVIPVGLGMTRILKAEVK
ncbi:ABC transporter permease [Nocardioides plantarum]|uniref:ABC transporter permease n=1 Tax=Nocardioides plantarum TaxID=29299 RepID=A0ABV5K9L0_9ACTN|nr:ABC transporter permease [Nocardioides plantarum]